MMFLLFVLCCGTPPSWLKVIGGGGGWVGGLQDFSVSPSPLCPNGVFELGWTGLGLGLGVLGTRFWGQGLTTANQCSSEYCTYLYLDI